MAKVVMCSWGQLDGARSNMGDIVIFESMVSAIRRLDPDGRIVAFSAEPEETRSRYGVEAHDLADPRGVVRFLAELATADLVLLGGGELVQDRSSKAYLLANLGPGILAGLSRRPFMAYAVGVSGPLETSPFGRFLAGKVLARADAITVRDEPSAQHLRDYGVDPAKVEVTADAAFQHDLAGEHDWRSGLVEFGLDPNRPYAVFAVRSFSHRRGGVLPAFVKRKLGIPMPKDALMERRRLALQLARVIDTVVASKGLQVLLLPAQQASRVAFDDRDFCDQVAQACSHSNGVGILREQTSVKALVSYLRHAEFLVGTPLHSLILASIAHLPMVALCYASKVERFMERLGLSHFALDLYRTSTASLPVDRVLGLIDEVLDRRRELSDILAQAHRDMAAKAAGNERRLASLLGRV